MSRNPTIYCPIFFLRILPRTALSPCQIPSYDPEVQLPILSREPPIFGNECLADECEPEPDQRHCTLTGESDIFARGHIIVRAIGHWQKASKLRAGLSLRRHQGPDPDQVANRRPRLTRSRFSACDSATIADCFSVSASWAEQSATRD